MSERSSRDSEIPRIDPVPLSRVSRWAGVVGDIFAFLTLAAAGALIVVGLLILGSPR